MSSLITFLFYSLLVCIHAEFNVTSRVPNATLAVSNTTQSFTIQIDQPVNRPTFSAFICVCNASSNTSVFRIDVSNNSTSTVIYNNYSLTFSIPLSFYNTKNEFYITFDAGVFFSNTSNSTARNDSQFWHLTVIDLGAITTGMPYLSSGVSTNMMTGSSVSYTVTSTAPMTTMSNISSTINQTMQTATATTTTTSTVRTNTGEPSPTRSAQLGMGLGITFISIAIIAEIIYFKYCYSGSQRSGSYYT